MGEGEQAQPFPLGLIESHSPDPDIFPSPQRLWGFTCRTRPERGSITRSFLSLHVVVSKLPSVLKDMQRITSEWQSIIFTGSPTSRFQMRTCEGGHARGVCPQSAPEGPGRDAPCGVGVCWEAGQEHETLYRRLRLLIPQILYRPLAEPSPSLRSSSVSATSEKD